MPRKRMVTGRDGELPREDATVGTHGTGIPKPRESESDKNQLAGAHGHGTTKGKKVPIKEKTR